MTTNKVRMGGVDIACLHGNHVADKLIGWLHAVLEEVDDNEVEPIFELGVSFECLLTVNSSPINSYSQSSPKGDQVSESTHHTQERSTSTMVPLTFEFVA